MPKRIFGEWGPQTPRWKKRRGSFRRRPVARPSQESAPVDMEISDPIGRKFCLALDLMIENARRNLEGN